MNKKKILLFVDWYLPGYKAGGPIRSCANLVAHLSSEFEFNIVTRNVDYNDPIPYENVQYDKWNILSNGTNVYYFSQNKLSAKGIRAIIDSIDCDTVYVNGIFSFYFSILPIYFSKRKKVVVAPRGMLAEGALSVKATKKILFLFLAKSIQLFRDVIFHATNEKEKEDILLHFPHSKIKIAPNLFRVAEPGTIVKRTKESGILKLVSFARISPEKNTRFALEILKDVNGSVEFDIYGSVNDALYWEECKKVIAQLPSNITVRYNHPVPNEKVKLILEKTHFMFLPSLGENFGHIILESLAAGCPVVISDKTPWVQLKDAGVGWDISLNNPAEFTSTIERCVRMSQQEYESYSNASYSFAKSVINNPALVDENRKLFL